MQRRKTRRAARCLGQRTKSATAPEEPPDFGLGDPPRRRAGLQSVEPNRQHSASDERKTTCRFADSPDIIESVKSVPTPARTWKSGRYGSRKSAAISKLGPTPMPRFKGPLIPGGISRPTTDGPT